MANIDYHFKCTNCHKEKFVQFEISDEDAARIENNETKLKDVLKPGTFQKELFISGFCYECQEKTFNRPAPGHEKEWGEVEGECPVCGAPLYRKDVARDKCPTCGIKTSAALRDIMSEEE